MPPNRVYGVRTRRGLANAANWYAINRIGGWCLLAACLAYLAVSAVLPAGEIGAWLLHLAAFAGSLALGIFFVHRYAKTR